MKIFSILALISLMSCSSTTYKDFKKEDIDADEGVAIGRVNIIYNGKNMNTECAVCLSSVNGPCQNLTRNGLVFLNVPKGEASVRRVACKDGSVHHYNIEGANFTVDEGVTYFGDILIKWKNSGGFKVSTLFGAIGGLISESSNDGTVTMSVSEEKKDAVIAAYKKHTKDKKLEVSRSISSVGK